MGNAGLSGSMFIGVTYSVKCGFTSTRRNLHTPVTLIPSPALNRILAQSECFPLDSFNLWSATLRSADASLLSITTFNGTLKWPPCFLRKFSGPESSAFTTFPFRSTRTTVPPSCSIRMSSRVV